MSGLFVEELLFEEETFQINGAIFEVYREMGSGYLEAVRTLAPEHEAQVLNYLKGTGMRLGILANFGSYPKAQVRRLIM